jgi:hypothetical protein
MNKKEKFYILAFVLSLASLVAAVALKMCGATWFDSAPIVSAENTPTQYMADTKKLIVQRYLMVWWITWVAPKELASKYIPFVLLNVILYFIPENCYLVSCIIMLFTISFAISPKFSTILKFIYGLIVISIIQQASIWLKFNLFGWSATYADVKSILIGNVDQFILFSLFYYFNVKCGDKYAVLAFLGKKK